MDFSSLITAVQSGKIDISLAGMTVNEERKKNVDFTDSYAKGVQVVIVKDDSDITSVDDLANDKLIGVQEGTTGHAYCSDDYGRGARTCIYKRCNGYSGTASGQGRLCRYRPAAGKRICRSK